MALILRRKGIQINDENASYGKLGTNSHRNGIVGNQTEMASAHVDVQVMTSLRFLLNVSGERLDS